MERRDEPTTDLRPSRQVIDPQELFEERPEAKTPTAPVSARLTMDWKAKIQEVVQSGVFRMKTESDLVRTAILRFMRNEVLPAYDSGLFSTHVRAMNRIDRIADELTRAIEVRKPLHKLKEAIRQSLAARMPGQARAALKRTMIELKAARDEEWAEAMLGAIKSDPLCLSVLAQDGSDIDDGEGE